MSRVPRLGTQEFLKVDAQCMIIAVANVALLVDWGARLVRVALGRSVGDHAADERRRSRCHRSSGGSPHHRWRDRPRRVRPLGAKLRPTDRRSRSTAEYRLHALACAPAALSSGRSGTSRQRRSSRDWGRSRGRAERRRPALLSYGLRVNGAGTRSPAPSSARASSTHSGSARAAGPKNACLEGECGSCSVLIDGVSNAPAQSPPRRDRDVVTIEGLTPADGELSDIQEAFRGRGRRPVRLLHTGASW